MVNIFQWNDCVYQENWETNVYNLVKPQRTGIAFPDPVKKAPKLNLHLTGRDLHEYLRSYLVNNNERVDSLQILKADATLEEAKAILTRADIALRSANKHLLAMSIEAGINFERAIWNSPGWEEKWVGSLLGTLDKGNYQPWKESRRTASSNKQTSCTLSEV